VSAAPLEPVALAGEHVELRPMSLDDTAGLIDAYAAGTMDLFSRTDDVLEPIDQEHAELYVREALDGWAAGEYLPFTVFERASGRVIGATRYGDIDLAVPRVEIGWTWYTPDQRGTSVNPECKLLLLDHAFGTLGCRVVRLKTSGFNERSQRAIARLGARRDGVLRRDRYQRDGRLRDTVAFSILDDEWPAVREQLLARLAGAPAEPVAAGEPLVLRAANPDDAEAFLDFALRNREHFMPFEPIRGDAAFTLEAMRERMTPSELRIPYVAVRGGRVVGQATLSNISRGAFQNATLGYSVDEHESGRGLATQLVRHVAHEAFTAHQLHRIEAGTLLHNLASQRVLVKAGFRQLGISPRHVRIAGRWQDHVLYSRTAEDDADMTAQEGDAR
jgi:RimJ/RimL family protein N-acetyltransferase